MKMVDWDEFKKELNIPEDERLLARVKLDLSILIYNLRKSKKMSQKALAKTMKVSQAYIAKVEGGEENLTLETIVKILAALHTSLRLQPEKRGKQKSVLHILEAA